MAYKEIQVPNGTVRAIYENFLKHVKPLAEQQERKNTEQEAINKAYRINEKKLRAQYREISGSNYSPYLGLYDDYYAGLSFGISYTAIDALRDTETMLNAVKFSDGDLTMTAQQVEAMEDIRSGNLLKYIEKDVSKPVKAPRSFWQGKIDMLLKEQKLKPAPAPMPVAYKAPEKETPGSFGHALAVIGLLSIVVVALIKSCGG